MQNFLKKYYGTALGKKMHKITAQRCLFTAMFYCVFDSSRYFRTITQ